MDALTTWVGQIPEHVVTDMHNVAPMLTVLGYDPYSNPPDYGKPDTFVVKNTNDINKNKHNWERKVSEYRVNVRELVKRKKNLKDVTNKNSESLQEIAIRRILNNQTVAHLAPTHQ